MAVEAPEFRVIPRNRRMGPLASARPHEAGALQVGWPQTPASWVRGPQTLRGHCRRLADLSGLWPGPCTSGLSASRRDSWEPTHLGRAPSPPVLLPALQAIIKARISGCSGPCRTPALCVSA